MKVILDTNVFISGIFWSGPPYQILEAWRDKKLTLAVTSTILQEYTRVAEALSAKYPQVDLTLFMELLAINSELYVPALLPKQISSDPDDDKFIACAISARIQHIVSGDADLLTISGYNGIEVLKPRQFVKRYL